MKSPRTKWKHLFKDLRWLNTQQETERMNFICCYKNALVVTLMKGKLLDFWCNKKKSGMSCLCLWKSFLSLNIRKVSGKGVGAVKTTFKPLSVYLLCTDFLSLTTDTETQGLEVKHFDADNLIKSWIMWTNTICTKLFTILTVNSESSLTLVHQVNLLILVPFWMGVYWCLVFLQPASSGHSRNWTFNTQHQIHILRLEVAAWF